MVCLINDEGIESRILIDCNRSHLRDNCAIPFTDDYVSDTDDSDFIAEFEEVDGLYYNQLGQSFSFTELKAYKVSYTLFLSWRNYIP